MRRTSSRTRRSTSNGATGSGPPVPSATAQGTNNATTEVAASETATESTRSSTEATGRGGRRRASERSSSNENRTSDQTSSAASTSTSSTRTGRHATGKASKKRAVSKKRGASEVEGEKNEAEGDDATVQQPQPIVVFREDSIPSVTGRVLAALQLLASDSDRCSNAFSAISSGRFSGILLQLSSSEEEPSTKTKGRGRAAGKPMAKSRKPSKKKSTSSRSNATNYRQDEALNATAEVDANLIAVSTFLVNGIVAALLEKNKQCQKLKTCEAQQHSADQEKGLAKSKEAGSGDDDVEMPPVANDPLIDADNVTTSPDDEPDCKKGGSDKQGNTQTKPTGEPKESPMEGIDTDINHSAELMHLAVALAALCRQLSAVIVFDTTGDAAERCFNSPNSSASAENAVNLGDIPSYFIQQSQSTESTSQPPADMKQAPSSVVGRAIVSVTVGSVLAMESLAKGTADGSGSQFLAMTAASKDFGSAPDVEGKTVIETPTRLLLRSAMWSALKALEMLVSFTAKRGEHEAMSKEPISSILDMDTSRLYGLGQSGGATRDKRNVEADASSSASGISIVATAPDGTTSSEKNPLPTSRGSAMGTPTSGSAPQHLHAAPNDDFNAAWSTVFARYLETDTELCFEQRTPSDAAEPAVSELAADSVRFQLLSFACQEVDRLTFTNATDDRAILSKALELLFYAHTATRNADEMAELVPPAKRVRWDEPASERGLLEEISSSTRSGTRRRSARSITRSAAGEASRGAQKTAGSRAQGATSPPVLPSNNMRVEQFVRFDERIAAKRLASVGLMWLCEGHRRLIETAAALLSGNDDTYGERADGELMARKSLWVDIMEISGGFTDSFGIKSGEEKSGPPSPASPSLKKGGGSPPTKKRTRGRRAKLSGHDPKELSMSSLTEPGGGDEVDASSSGPKGFVAVPGNVALVALVACIIDLLSESLSRGGVRPPTGGINLYVGGVVLRLDAFQNWREVVIEATTPRTTSPPEAVSAGMKEAAASVAESLSSQLGGARTSSRTRSSRNSRRTPAARSPTPSNPPAIAILTSTDSKNEGSTSHPAGTTVRVVKIPDPPMHDWKRPDVRTDAAVLMRLMVISHRRCLHENLSSLLSRGRTDVNDCVSSCVHAHRYPHVAGIEEIFEGCGNDLLVNGDSWDSSMLSTALVSQFYPFVHSALETLAKAAASSSIEIARSIDPTPASERLIALASAFTLGDAMYGDDPARTMVTDARLCSLAVTQLLECLSAAISDARTTSSGASAPGSAGATGGTCTNEDGDHVMDDAEDSTPEGARQQRLIEALISRHRLDKPLAPVISKEHFSPSSDETYGGCFPLPSDVASAAVQDDASLFVAFQTGMGLLSGRRRARPDEILSIFLRAIVTSRDGSSISSTVVLAKAMRDLISRLLRIVSSCYAYRHFGLRAASSDENVEVDGSKETEPRETFISIARAVLASDVLTALRRCLAHVRSNHASRRQSPAVHLPNLRSLIRHIGLSTEHVVFAVELGHLFDRIVLRPRTHYKPQQNSEDTKSCAVLSVEQSPPEFTPWERRLWLSHIKFCVAVGRGKTSFDSLHFSNSEDVGQPGQGRYEVLLRVASGPLREAGGERAKKNDESVAAQWPLFLSPVQQALVSANLASEPLPASEDAARPEMLVCDGMIASISNVIHELRKQPSILSEDDVRQVMWYPWSPTNGSVLLSLHDCRLLTLAVCRLPDDLRAKTVSRILELVKETFSWDEGLEWKESLMTRYSEVSSFVARLLTVVATIVDIVNVKSDLLELLCLQVGPTHYHLPTWLPTSPDSPGSPYEQDSMRWYRRDRCFMGLFSDWESPSLPATNVSGFSETLATPVIEELCSSLRIAFEVGFISSKYDRCHLLFAGWNALGRSSGWYNKAPSLISPSGLDSKRISDQVLDIRKAMFQLFRHAHGKERAIRETLLTQVLQMRHQALDDPSNGEKSLPLWVSVVSEALDVVEKKHSESVVHVALNEFVLVECTAILVSFLVALHTRSDVALFPESDDGDKPKTEMRKKKSSMASTCDDVIVDEGDDTVQSDDSGDSDIVYAAFEDDDVEEAKIDALARLHDSCNALGCAPVHPDYLDTSCTLSANITPVDALQSAHKALASLTKLAITAWKMMTQRQIEGLASANVVREEGSRLAQPALAVQLQWSGLQDPTIYSDDEDDPEVEQSYRSTVAALCNVDDSSIDLFDLGRPAGYQMNGGKRLWCPNASHQISGKLREVGASLEGWKASASEYRATREWEVLLSECIQATCLYGVSTQDESESESSADRQELFLQAKCWRRILETCVTSLAPAAALLRFGLRDGKGGPSHPLQKNTETSDDEQVLTTTALGDEVFATGENASNLRCSVTQTISFLSFLSSNKEISDSTRQNCRACVGHLVNGSEQVDAMERLWSSLLAAFGIAGVRNVIDSQTADLPQATGEAVDYVLNHLLRVVEEQTGTGSADSEGFEVEADSREVDVSGESRKSLLGGLGCGAILTFNTIVDRHLDATEAAASVLAHLETRSSNLNASCTLDVFAKSLINMLIRRELIGLDARVKVAFLARRLIETEQEQLKRFVSGDQRPRPLFLEGVINALDGIENPAMEQLVDEDLCTSAQLGDLPERQEILRRQIVGILFLCVGVAFPCQVREGGGLEMILEVLLAKLGKWAPGSDDLVMDLAFALSSRFKQLTSVGDRLMETARKEDGKMHEPLHMSSLDSLEQYFRFIRDLRLGIDKSRLDVGTDIHSVEPPRILVEKEVDSDSKEKIPESFYYVKGGSRMLRTCSYVKTGGDFVEQHWYVCYTCGLSHDKGCCSLCALTCHKGHDVGYSRKSSFFCDCGAESSKALENNRVPCKCLHPLSDDEMAQVFDAEPSHAEEPLLQCSDDTVSELEIMRNDAIAHIAADKPRADALWVDFASAAKENNWLNDILRWLVCSFQSWFGMMSKRNHAALHECFEQNSESMEAGGTSSTTDLSLEYRKGKGLVLAVSDADAMLLSRSTKSAVVNVRLSVDSSSDRMKKAIMTKHDIKRQALVADGRGRMIIAEPAALLFCTALPSVNLRHVNRPLESPLDRSQLCILGSSKVNFSVVGMQLCPQNDRHLLVWGTSEVCVVVLNWSCDRVVRRIELSLDLEPGDCESEYVIKCEWMPSSEAVVAVVCGAFVKFFNTRRSTWKSGVDTDLLCRSMTCYTVAYEDAVIRSSAFVEFGDEAPCDTGGVGNNEGSFGMKLALLFDSGRLHMVELAFDSNGDLEDQGETYIEVGEGVQFPIAGVRRYGGSSPEGSNSVATSFGEGSSLHFLRRSGLLLYKCVSSCTLALMIGNDGQIVGSFEFLPHMLSPSTLGSDSDGYSISAPFTHWTELGIIRKKEGSFYRVAVVGKSMRTNQGKLLCIEFNKDKAYVKEIGPPASSNTGFNTGIEGMTTFSAPYLQGEKTGTGMVGKHGYFVERLFLVALTSSGALQFHGEDVDVKNDIVEAVKTSVEGGSCDNVPGEWRRSGDAREDEGDRIRNIDNANAPPSFPLTIFETLRNVSGTAELEFGGDGASGEPDTVKRKLAITNGDFLISPSREGCTLTCALKSSQPQVQAVGATRLRRSHTVSKNEDIGNKVSHEDPQKKVKQESQDGYAITAVRLLVGATATEYLPRRVAVMGRPLTMMEGSKRWYDIPLTDEEIMMGIRNGFVSITIGPSFDSSNNSIIDAAEVYATKRSAIPFLRLQDDPTAHQIQYSSVAEKDNPGTDEFDMHRNQLCLCLRFVINICRTFGSNADMSTIDATTLESLIQLTMFDGSLDPDIRGLVVEMVDLLNGSVAQQRKHLIKRFLMKGIVCTLNGMRDMALGNDFHTATNSIWLGLRRFERNRATGTGEGRYSIELLDQCLQGAINVLQSRPSIYSEVLATLLPQMSGQNYLSVHTKTVLDAVTKKDRTADISETASRITHLALLELSLLQGSSLESSAVMEMLRILLKSQDSQVVTRCCQALREGLREKGTHQGIRQQQKPMSEQATSVPGVAYQCDGCQALPITDLRYTLEGDNVDLCERCWQKCRTYANGRDGSEPVVVDGKHLKVGDTKVMTCAQIQEMRQLKVLNTIVKQVEQVLRVTDNSSAVDTTMAEEEDDAAALKLAIRLSLESETADPKVDMTGKTRDLARSHVSDLIFSAVLDLGVRSLATEEQEQVIHRLPVLQLLLSLVISAENEETELKRGRLVCERTCEEIRRLVEAFSSNAKSRLTATRRSSFVLSFRLLRSLMEGQEQLSASPLAYDSNGFPDPTGVAKELKTSSLTFSNSASVCETHEVAAVRRRCREGLHKGRHFFICGMERRHRCAHFKWENMEFGAPQKRHMGLDSATLSPSEGGFSSKKAKTRKGTVAALQEEMWKLFSVGSLPLEAQLCALLEVCVQDSELRHVTINRTDDDIQDENQVSPSCLLESLKTEKCAALEKRDGVDKARNKLCGVDSLWYQRRARRSSSDQNVVCISSSSKSRDIDVVQSCLELISQFASTALLGFSPKEISSTWSSCWFALLCEMIGTSKSSVMRHQAKKILKRLCGGRRNVYHQVRDHYVFSLHFRNLLAYCEGPLEAALDVREMARRCGPTWRQDSLSWSKLSAGSLLGVEDLIPEDSLTLSCQKRMDQVLDALLQITKSRGNNWRQFCATAELPQKGSGRSSGCPPGSGSGADSHFGTCSKENNCGSTEMSSRPPIFCLFWMGCALHGPTQVKVFRLIDAAMSNSGAKEPRRQEKQVSFVTHEESCDGVSSEGGSDAEAAVTKGPEQDHPKTLTKGSPEDTLLLSAGGLGLGDIYAFVMHFVLRGRVREVRNAAGKVAQDLLLAVSSNDLNTIFVRFIAVLSGSEISTLGSAAVEFLQFMNNFVSDHASTLSPSIPLAAKAVVEWATQQLKALDDGIFSGIEDDASVVEVQNESRACTRKRIDLSSCVHCSQNIVLDDDGSDSRLVANSSVTRQSSGRTGGIDDDARVERGKSVGGEEDESPPKLNCFPWLAERIRQQTKLRLDASADNCVSTEFASHFQLKGRLAIFDVTLSVTDPRGRLLKTVGIYFTPRQVEDIQELKSSQYKPLWQRCGTLSLSRGSTQATFRFPTPICATNLKFEYLEFFERGGASRTSGGVGGMVLHCPRCTRVVNNAHGVCGHCGEVAFQCRRCRHINYDRLDAFLCVECGYCASGEFCFELMTSAVCNAPSIVDDDGYERAVKQLRAANRQHGESRNSLRKKLIAQASSRRKRSRGGDVEDVDDLAKYGSQMKRAMLGELPKGLGRSGGEITSSHFAESTSRRSASGSSFVSSSAHRQEQSVRSVSGRARSLISLGRQLRGEAGTSLSGAVDSDRPSSREAPVRQAIVGGSAGASAASAASSLDGFEDADMDIQRIIGEGSSSGGAISSILSSIDVGDPLSRLVANIQARARSNTSRGSGRTSDADGSNAVLGSLGRDGSEKSSREDAVGSIFGGLQSEGLADSSANPPGSVSNALIALKEIEKQHREMREAEKESYELTRTINAWKRLNCDTLADFGGSVTGATVNGRFVPSYCSACAGGVALNLLLLVWSFLAVGSHEEDAFGASFVRVLFDGPNNAHATIDELDRLKRLVIVTLATRSSAGSKLVLKELKWRLLGRMSRDTSGAEILGIVLEQDFDGVDEYVKLATEVLEKCL